MCLESVFKFWGPSFTSGLMYRHMCKEERAEGRWRKRKHKHDFFTVMPTIFQALNKPQKHNQNKILKKVVLFSHSHFSLFLTVYLLKCCFVAWQRGGGGGGGGAGIAQWLEHRTRDWKVAGLNPCWNGRRIFILQGRLSALTLISVSVPPPCYHSST